MNTYLAWDIEIAKTIPDGETDWKTHRPLGISCAATIETWQAGQSITSDDLRKVMP